LMAVTMSGAVGGWIVTEVLRQIRRGQSDDAEGHQGKQDG
jgi:hypothetical protein